MAASKSNKTRKIGRNKLACESYRREDRQKKNAAIRQAKHLKRIAMFQARAAKKEGVAAPAK